MPGVVLLDEMLRVLEVHGAAGGAAGTDGGWILSSAKFLHPVRPGETLTFEHDTLSSGSIRFAIRSVAAEGMLVATGTLMPKLPTRESGDGHEAG